MKKELLVLIFIILFTSLSLALEWPLGKNATCNLFNISDSACDEYWCDIIQEGNYSVTREICVFNNVTFNDTCVGFLNNTNYTNQTNFSLFNESIYYNKTETNALIDNKTITLRDTILDGEENRTKDLVQREISNRNLVVGSSNSGGTDTTLIIIVALIVAGLIGFMSFSKNKAIKTPPTGRAFQRGNLNPNKFSGVGSPLSKESLEDELDKDNETDSDSGEDSEGDYKTKGRS